MSRYVARFEAGDKYKESQKAKKQETSQIVNKERKFDTKTIGKAVTTGVAVTVIASQLYQKQQSKVNTITGNSIAQRRLSNRMAYLNEGLSMVGTLGVTAIVNPALLPVAVAGLAFQKSMQAYSMIQENQVKQAQWQIESIVNNEAQSRLVKDVTGVRI